MTVEGDVPTPDPREAAADLLQKLKGDLSYAIEDVPPWYTAILLGFQVRLVILALRLPFSSKDFGRRNRYRRFKPQLRFYQAKDVFCVMIFVCGNFNNHFKS